MREAVRMRRILAIAASVIVALLALSGTADAHVEPTVEEVRAGAPASVGFAPEHGCDESPTVRVEIQVPAAVTDAKPAPKEGWTGAAEDDVIVFDWGGVGGEPAGGVFTVDFTAPNKPGSTLIFPTIQTCAEGSIDWIDTDAGGDYPAPRVAVVEGPVQPPSTATTAAHSETTGAAEASSETTTATAEPGEEEPDDSSDSRPIAIIAMVAVVIAAGVGGAAWLRRRQEA